MAFLFNGALSARNTLKNCLPQYSFVTFNLLFPPFVVNSERERERGAFVRLKTKALTTLWTPIDCERFLKEIILCSYFVQFFAGFVVNSERERERERAQSVYLKHAVHTNSQ
jgi:hypothetical protein